MLNITKQQYILGAVILITSTASVSKEISYDYVQGTYISSAVEVTPTEDLDTDEGALFASFSVSPVSALTVGYSVKSFDEHNGIDVDVERFSIGATVHTEIDQGSDVFANVSIMVENAEADDGTTKLKDDDSGYIARFGLRSSAGDNLEVEIAFAREEIFDSAVNTIGFGVRYYVYDGVSLGAGFAANNDDDKLLSLNARVNFK